MSVKISKKYIDLDPLDTINGLCNMDIKEPSFTVVYDSVVVGDIDEILYGDGRKIKIYFYLTNGDLKYVKYYTSDDRFLYCYYYQFDSEGNLTSQTYFTADPGN